jgi:putative transposase
MNKRILTADRWRELIEQQQRSGLSIAAFCAEHDVAVSTFFAWRRKLEIRGAPGAPGISGVPAFVELTPSIEPAAARGSVELLPAPIELLLPGGLTVRVRENFDAATLRQIVEALR